MTEKTVDGHEFVRMDQKTNPFCATCDEVAEDHIGHLGKTERTNPEKVNARFYLEKQIYKDLGCTEELTLEFIKQTMYNIQLFDKKQRDYGSGNIARFGEQGVLVRSSDKFERLVTLSKQAKPTIVIDPAAVESPGKVIYMKKGRWQDAIEATTETTPQNESIEDTWKDISIYATIALLVRKGVWPKY